MSEKNQPTNDRITAENGRMLLLTNAVNLITEEIRKKTSNNL